MFGFTGRTVAISFGPLTSKRTLVGYRIGGTDWTFVNVTAGATQVFVDEKFFAAVFNINATTAIPPDEQQQQQPQRFELRVASWDAGVQVDRVRVGPGKRLVPVPRYDRAIEFIGDSLSAGMYQAREGLASFAFDVGAGFGDTEYAVIAYPGICAADHACCNNSRGQAHQWFYTSDTSKRADRIWGGRFQ